VEESEVPPALAVRGLEIDFGSGPDRVPAVRGVDLDLAPGECLALVGESGSGKSATARALLGLAGPGSVVRADRLEVAGQELLGLDPRRRRELRGRAAGLVPQDALASLDPLRTVGAEIGEALANHRVVARRERAARVVSLLERVRVPEPGLRARQHPHQLSGGLRQRALIAAALAADPPLLIADEPTTALDVTIAARILDLLDECRARGTAILLISHDLAVVARLADRIAVMHAGVVVEAGATADLLGDPTHPYTRELLAAVPSAHAKGTRLSSVAGARAAATTGPASEPATGCRYAGRCPLVTEVCRDREPALAPVGPARVARCWHAGEPVAGPGVVTSRPAVGPPREQPQDGSDDGDEREAVLEVDAVSKRFRGPGRSELVALEEVSFTLRAGETLGIVGESGSGKSTLANLVMGLLEPDAGRIRLTGEPWSHRPEAQRRALRPRIQLVQQDPLSSFDPRYPVERIIGEGLGRTGRRAARDERERIAELLALVGLDRRLLARRPRELSGGQRQRVAIARALAPQPPILVCDEPVSALDVSVQAQILDLFADIRERLGLSMVFISHDLDVVRHVADRVLVLRAGQVVESGSVEAVFADPRHPYTRNLLAARPSLPGTRTPVTSAPPVMLPPPAMLPPVTLPPSVTPTAVEPDTPDIDHERLTRP
jgi:peptide/nickel transport system ATP-binding protein